MQHPPVMPSHGYVAPVYPPWAINASMHQQQQQQEGEAGGEAEEESQYAGEVEESPPSYVLSEEAIALFAQGEERRRRDRTRVCCPLFDFFIPPPPPRLPSSPTSGCLDPTETQASSSRRAKRDEERQTCPQEVWNICHPQNNGYVWAVQQSLTTSSQS